MRKPPDFWNIITLIDVVGPSRKDLPPDEIITSITNNTVRVNSAVPILRLKILDDFSSRSVHDC